MHEITPMRILNSASLVLSYSFCLVACVLNEHFTKHVLKSSAFTDLKQLVGHLPSLKYTQYGTEKTPTITSAAAKLIRKVFVVVRSFLSL